MDKRRAKRYRRQLTVLFGENVHEHVGLTGDISAEGLLLRASRIYPPGTGVSLELSTADQQKIRCRGVVRWAKRVPSTLVTLVKNGMGIFLTDVPLEYEQLIQKLRFARTAASHRTDTDAISSVS